MEFYKNYEAAIRVKEALIAMAKELNALDKGWYKDAIYDINEIISYFYRGQVFFMGGPGSFLIEGYKIFKEGLLFFRKYGLEKF